MAPKTEAGVEDQLIFRNPVCHTIQIGHFMGIDGSECDL